ncbi:MAG: hypothetical protein ABI478_14420, partial [Propionivibrio sp.]
AKGSGASMEIGPGLAPMMPYREDIVFLRGLYNQEALTSTSPHLGRMPNRNEVVELDGLRFLVLRADSRRLYTLFVSPISAVPDIDAAT